MIINNGWHFDHSYSRLEDMMFSRINPTPVRAPKLILFNTPLSNDLGLDFATLSPQQRAELLSGNILPKGSLPIAQAYAGHQFGNFTRLGDGRAILLGEHLTPNNQRVDIQLKGSGPTPYSRQGDGRAALGPMLREYLISEAMFALGIPTTRSLAVISTGEKIHRNTPLPGAILTRIATSHIRVGTFEYVASHGDARALQTMVHYTIKRHYPHLELAENQALELLKAVIEKQIALIIHWMRVGFIHGVMNTDNMAISGETIDYGPCAFMNSYDPKTVFSSIDRYGRYAFGNQPKIALWNLARFAETLLPVLDNNQQKAIQMAEETLSHFATHYQSQWSAMMRKKLGLFGEEGEDEILINDLLHWMEANKADYTNSFRILLMPLFQQDKLYQDELFQKWHQRWSARRTRSPHSLEASNQLMRANNPVVIPRNHLVEEALDAANTDGNLALIKNLIEVLSQPYDDKTPHLVRYQTPPEQGCFYQTFCGT